MKKIFGIILLIGLVTATDALAQTALGLSYERRNEAPTNGFGIQLERGILGSIPVVDVRARIHGSFFTEAAELNQDAIQNSLTGLVDGTAQSYDFGAAVIGGVGLGLFRPYAGLGVGMENWEFEDYENSTHYYYGLAGIAITPIPFVKPYLEFRFSSYDDLSEARQEIGEGNARVHLGVTIGF
ncbi:MAG: hypothetical protein HLUCCA01_05345 [Bacteroidetes bacterium HLUCCA01]|nr:MAG: hypothetical protein HLUCCA01_05345 [Bacteroidetes bacterium HLUCCA01]